MKSVMISIKPKWCELIANGKKTIELRKTKPKIEIPFKCYIYCTKENPLLGNYSRHIDIIEDEDDFDCYNKDTLFKCNGKVIGEFVCDNIVDFFPVADLKKITPKIFDICLDSELNMIDLCKYSNGKTLYGWHISDLKIYDEPKELNEFKKPCISPEMPYCPACKVGCEYISESEAEFYRIDGTCDTEWVCLNYIKRPPQSWCYVENFEG